MRIRMMVVGTAAVLASALGAACGIYGPQVTPARSGLTASGDLLCVAVNEVNFGLCFEGARLPASSVPG